MRAREKAYGAGRLSMDELTHSVASLFAHVAHADSLQLRDVFERTKGHAI